MYFNFLSVLFTRAQPKGPHPPTPGSHASARQRLAPRGPVNELRGRDAAGPEAGKTSGRAGPDPRRGPRERGEGSGRPGRGGDSCDPAPLSHLEHVAGSGGSGGGQPALTPPTTERSLRRPARARFLRPQMGRGAGDGRRANSIRPRLSSEASGGNRDVELQRVAPRAASERKPRLPEAPPLRRRLLGGGKAPPQCGRHAGVRGGRYRPRAPLGIGLRRCDWAPSGVG